MVKPLNEHNLRATPKQIGEAFARLGYLKLGEKRVGAGDNKVMMWAVRNFETYQDMEAPQLRQVWLSQVNSAPMDPSLTVDALQHEKPKNPLEDKKPM